jgi:hypothetical protein
MEIEGKKLEDIVGCLVERGMLFLDIFYYLVHELLAIFTMFFAASNFNHTDYLVIMF